MKIQKKTSMGGEWAKAGEHIKDGDKIKLLNAGEIVAGEFGDRHVFQIMTRDKKQYNLSFNQTSLNNLVDAFGDDSDQWVGKVVNVFVVKVMVSGKMRNVAYIAAPGWTMNDDGSFKAPAQTDTTKEVAYPKMDKTNDAAALEEEPTPLDDFMDEA